MGIWKQLTVRRTQFRNMNRHRCDYIFFFAIAKAGGGRQGRMRSKTNVNLYGSTIHIVFDGEECIY